MRKNWLIVFSIIISFGFAQLGWLEWSWWAGEYWGIHLQFNIT